MASKRAAQQNLWRPLRAGDTVDIVAPGFACGDEALKGAMHLLALWGLEARVPRAIFGRDVLCSNRDEVRLTQLRDALTARDSQAVWCLRGGYGSLRLIPGLTRVKRPSGAPKLFVGLSDISTLHVYLNQVWGWPTVHGPLLDRLGKGLGKPAYVRELRNVFFGEIPELIFDRLRPLNEAARRNGTIKGIVSGGNLVTLQSSIGTNAEWETDGQILFFEEIGERGYKIDRILEHFRQTGKFKRARAVIFGEFLGGLETDGSSRIPAVLKRFAESVSIPVMSGLKSGHGVIQRPVPFYTQSRLELQADGPGRLICASGAEQSAR